MASVIGNTKNYLVQAAGTYALLSANEQSRYNECLEINNIDCVCTSPNGFLREIPKGEKYEKCSDEVLSASFLDYKLAISLAVPLINPVVTAALKAINSLFKK